MNVDTMNRDAVLNFNDNGYCILRDLFPVDFIQSTLRAALGNVKEVLTILQEAGRPIKVSSVVIIFSNLFVLFYIIILSSCCMHATKVGMKEGYVEIVQRHLHRYEVELPSI